MPGAATRAYGYTLGRATITLALAALLVGLPAGPLTRVACANAAPREAAPAEPGRAAPEPGATSAPAVQSPFEDDAAPSTTDDGSGASDQDSAGAAELPGASLHALACLEGEGGNDSDGARRGVQKRDFIKRHRVEVSLLGGHYAADVLSSTYTYGAAVGLWLSEDFGIEALLSRNPVQFRLEQPFTGFDREHHFQAGVAWNAMGAMVWAPIHAKLRWSERRITHADLSWLVGAGETFSDTAQGLTFQVGLGLRLYLSRFFSIRFDARDFVIPQEVLGRGRTSHNVVTLVGLCGWFPG